jgi:hypothetical protein
MLNKISPFTILSALSIFCLPMPTHGATGKALWHNLTQSMLAHHNIDVAVSFQELPSWIPFESFNFFNTIFVNTDIKNLTIQAQRAIIGHELSHIIAGHSSKQIALFLAGSLALAYSFKKCLQSELLSSLHSCAKTTLACITAYAWYYLFNAYVVYSHELNAERFNAIFLNNYEAVMKRLHKLLAIESQHNTSSWSETFFRVIAPRFPSAAEFLGHILKRDINI